MKAKKKAIVARTIPPQIAEAVAGMELVGAELVDRQAILESIEVLNGESLADRISTDITAKFLGNAQRFNEMFNMSALEILAKSFGNSAAETLAKSFGNSAAETLAKSFGNSAAETLAKSFGNSAAETLAKSFGNSAAETLAKSFGNSAAETLAKSFGNSAAETLAKSFGNSAAETLAKSFENSGAKALMDAAKISQERMSKIVDTSALESLAKSFENSGAKALMDAAKISQERMSKIVDTSALESLAKSFENSGAKALMDAAKISQERMSKIVGKGVLESLIKESQNLDRTIRQMKDSGWLVPTNTRGLWEFAPGSRAGSFTSSNTFMPLKAALTKKPDLHVAVTLESAAFIHQLSEHSPRKGVIAVPKGTSRKGSLARFRHVNLQLPEFATVMIDGIPVHTISGLLVAMAMRPMSYRDWPNVLKWLPIACNKVITAANEESGSLGGEMGLLKMLKDQPTTVIARVAYFFRVARHDSTARKILALISQPYEGPIYLGARDSVKMYATYDSLTKVYDNLIDLK